MNVDYGYPGRDHKMDSVINEFVSRSLPRHNSSWTNFRNEIEQAEFEREERFPDERYGGSQPDSSSSMAPHRVPRLIADRHADSQQPPVPLPRTKFHKDFQPRTYMEHSMESGYVSSEHQPKRFEQEEMEDLPPQRLPPPPPEKQGRLAPSYEDYYRDQSNHHHSLPTTAKRESRKSKPPRKEMIPENGFQRNSAQRKTFSKSVSNLFRKVFGGKKEERKVENQWTTADDQVVPNRESDRRPPRRSASLRSLRPSKQQGPSSSYGTSNRHPQEEPRPAQNYYGVNGNHQEQPQQHSSFYPQSNKRDQPQHPSQPREEHQHQKYFESTSYPTRNPSAPRQSSLNSAYHDHHQQSHHHSQQYQQHSLPRNGSRSTFYVSERPPEPYEELDGRMTPLLGGIVNIGNTCYINCVLQSLAATQNLSDVFLSNKYKRILEHRARDSHGKANGSVSSGFVSTTVAKIIQQLWLNKINKASTSALPELIARFSNQHRQSSDQTLQDAQEFLTYIFDQLHEDLSEERRDNNYNRLMRVPSDHPSSYRSIISQTFEAHLVSFVRCLHCKFEKRNYDPCLMMSLSMMDETMRPFFVTMIGVFETNRLMRFGIRVSVEGTVGDLKQCLIHEANIQRDKSSQLILFQLDGNGFRTTINDNTTLNTVQNSRLYAARLDYTKTDLMVDSINVIFILGIRSEGTFHRRSEPLICTLSRQMSYEDIARRLFLAARSAVRRDAIDYPPMREFVISIQDDWFEGTILDPTVSMPLFTEIFDEILGRNESAYPMAPRFVRMVVEFHPDSRCLSSVVETVVNHETATNLSFEGNQPKPFTLSRCLKDFTSEEMLHWKCEHCFRDQAQKQLLIHTLPPVLIFHIKRFKTVRTPTSEVHPSASTEDFTKTMKIGSPIEYPVDNLDVTSYLSNDCTNSDGTLLRRAKDVHGVDTSSDTMYSLYAIICHKGAELSAGHYFTVARNPTDGVWRCFDDTLVTTVHPDDFMEYAYILFYEKNSLREQRERVIDKANVQKRILQCLQNGLTKVNPLNSRENRENDYDDAPRRIPNGPLINAQRSPSLNFRREDASRRAATTVNATVKAGLTLQMPIGKRNKETTLW